MPLCIDMNLHVELAMPPCRPWRPAKRWWTEGELLVCECGHAHMGYFFCCSQCERTLCVPCFAKCSDATIRRKLAADVLDESARGNDRDVSINTCNTCGDKGKGEGKGMDRCQPCCSGRLKWTCTSSFGRLRFEHREPGACGCATCRDPRPFEISWDDERPVSTLMPVCRALRMRVVPAMRSQRFIDHECCMSCFRNMFWQIGTVAVKLTDHFRPAPAGEPWHEWRILFRASKRSWAEEKLGPPRNYIDSLEEGTKVHQLACGHVGRYWSCHADGHPCSCLSTSILASEALKRLEADMTLQIIFVPVHVWERVATDLSSPEAVGRIPISRWCRAFSITPNDVTKYSYYFREVVLDKTQLVPDHPPPLDFYVFEVPPDNETVAGVKECCKDAYDVMHQVCGRFLEAENHARNALVHLATPSFRSWLSSKRPPHAPMPERSPPPL